LDAIGIRFETHFLSSHFRDFLQRHLLAFSFAVVPTTENQKASAGVASSAPEVAMSSRLNSFRKWLKLSFYKNAYELLDEKNGVLPRVRAQK